jgi:hypothetical protein
MHSGCLSSSRSSERAGSGLGWSLALVAALFRLIPHPPNLTPLGALGLVSGARFSCAQALAMSLAALAVSDVLLHQVFGLAPFHPFVYASIALNVFLGRLLLQKRRRPARVVSVTLLASTQFFLISNFGVWVTWTLYPKTLAGLVECYVAALPFFQYTLVGDLLFTGALFGLLGWLSVGRFVPAKLVPHRRADLVGKLRLPT